MFSLSSKENIEEAMQALTPNILLEELIRYFPSYYYVALSKDLALSKERVTLEKYCHRTLLFYAALNEYSDRNWFCRLLYFFLKSELKGAPTKGVSIKILSDWVIENNWKKSLNINLAQIAHKLQLARFPATKRSLKSERPVLLEREEVPHFIKQLEHEGLGHISEARIEWLTEQQRLHIHLKELQTGSSGQSYFESIEFQRGRARWANQTALKSLAARVFTEKTVNRLLAFVGIPEGKARVDVV